MVRNAVLVVALLAASSVAHAQPAEAPALDVDPAIDLAVAAGAVAAIALPRLIPVGPDHWDLELWGPLDRRVRDNFSTDAAQLADATVLATVAVPVLFEVAEVIDDDTRRAGIAYAEALGVSLGLNAIAKYAVQRPRPYTYHRAPGVRSYTLAEGDDAYLSFYSGHASTAFAAAVAGSYLYGLRPGRGEAARSAMWFAEIALATATSNLRVRAGKHYYSDIAIGAVVGAAVGAGAPLLHATDPRAPSPWEWAAMGGGVVVGAAVSSLWPFGPDRALRATIAPVAIDDGGGVAIVGGF